MKAVLLVAAREFRQIVATKGFWVMLLIVPLAIVASAFAGKVFAPRTAIALTIVDPSGRYGPRLGQRLEHEYQRDVLRDLSTYVERWKLAPVDPAAPWSRRDSWASDAAVDRFAALGGSTAAIARLKPHLPADAPVFEPPSRFFHRVAPPAGVPTDKGAAAFGEAIAPALKGNVDTPDGKLPLALAIYLPEDLGKPGSAANVWTNGGPTARVLSIVRDELTAALQVEQLEAGGLDQAAAAQVQSLNAPIAIIEPRAGEERGVIAKGSIIPLAMVYLLLLTAITTGSMMLQGVVEERSNKLLESVLACISPAELMRGKLLGLGGVGLGIVLVWTGCGVAAAFYSPGPVSDLLRASFEALDGVWIPVALLFYFLTGYLIVSMLFLAIGSLSDSMQEAQSYLMPVLMVVMFPVIFVMQAAITGPDSLFVKVLSWIPLYAPFAMLARLGTGVSLAEVLGTGALIAAFVALELFVLGRLFQASVLNAGKPSLRDIFARVARRSANG